MKRKITIISLLVLVLLTLVSCDMGSLSNYKLIYDKQYQVTAVNDFNLSDILLYNETKDITISVTEDMLNAEDLNKTKIPGNHIIVIRYNGQEFECALTLVNTITYEVIYKYGLNPVLVEDFALSDITVKMNIDGNVKNVVVTEEMLSAEDLEKLQTEGTHTININYQGRTLSLSVILMEKLTEVTLSLENPYKTSLKISEFTLSNIKIKVNKNNGEGSYYIDVTEEMLSTEDLEKLQTEGTHNITVRYNDFVATTAITLIKDEEIEDVITYEIDNPFDGKEVKISEFNLSNIKIKEIVNGKINTYFVNTSMLSVSDANKINQEGTHKITINFKNFSEEITIILISENNNNNNNNNDVSNIANGYYNSAIGLSGMQLKYALRTIINTGTKDTSYDDLTTDLAKTDPGKTSGKILLFYLRTEVKAAWDSGKTWNREHVWPQSLGWFKTSGAGSDIHHIRPSDPGENSRRGNKKYGESGSAYEPNDNVKGDAARIIFYLLTRYSQTDSSYPVTKVATSMEMLLNWHQLDPVDDIERYRNEKAYEIQKNRNPFIDVPEYAFYIWDTSRLASDQKEEIEIVIEVKLVEYFEDNKRIFMI